ETEWPPIRNGHGVWPTIAGRRCCFTRSRVPRSRCCEPFRGKSTPGCGSTRAPGTPACSNRPSPQRRAPPSRKPPRRPGCSCCAQDADRLLLGGRSSQAHRDGERGQRGVARQFGLSSDCQPFFVVVRRNVIACLIVAQWPLKPLLRLCVNEDGWRWEPSTGYRE